MKPSLEKAGAPRRVKVFAAWMAVFLALYVFSTGPVAWATNDAFHPQYLPDAVWYVYLPLAPLGFVPGAGLVFEWWTAIVWHGFPAGYTTL